MPTRRRATSDAPGTRPWLEAGRKHYGRIPPGAAWSNVSGPPSERHVSVLPTNRRCNRCGAI